MPDVTIDRETFHHYESVRQGGSYNMMMEASTVMNIINVNEDQYFYILNNYSELLEKYGESND